MNLEEKDLRYSKWICSSLKGLELTLPVVVNYQYDKEAEGVVNFQVFLKGDEKELHDITEFISIEDAEFIHAEIVDAVAHGEY